MNTLAHKLQNRRLRRARVRATISGSATRPRLSVRITNRHIVAQLVDDTASRTLLYVTTVGQKQLSGTMSDKAVWVGEAIAKAAKQHKIKTVVFDRGSKLYHGRVAALADAARKQGLEF